MRGALQRGVSMKGNFQTGLAGNDWMFGLEHLRQRFLDGRPGRLPVAMSDPRRWQSLVPLLIRSFQLVRDILHALPLNDHAGLKEVLYGTGLQATMRLLTYFKGGASGQVWRFRCGLEVMKLALDPQGAVQRNQGFRDDVELPLLKSAVHCMRCSLGKCSLAARSLELCSICQFLLIFYISLLCCIYL